MSRLLVQLILAIMLVSGASPARAEILATFYSQDFGKNFPHAFVKVKGTVDATGEVVDTNYGFTATSISPAILMGSVNGRVKAVDAGYLAKSDPHFTLRLSDAEYARLLAVANKYSKLPGKSYNLGKRNCVHFIMDMAVALGLKVNPKTKFIKKPRSFLEEVKGLNKGLKL